MNIVKDELSIMDDLKNQKLELLDKIRYYGKKCEEARIESEKLLSLGDSVNVMESELKEVKEELEKDIEEAIRQKKEINSQKREILKFQETKAKQEEVLEKLREDISCDRCIDEEVLKSVGVNKKQLDELETKVLEKKNEMIILGKGIGDKNVELSRVKEDIEKIKRLNQDLVLNKTMLEKEVIRAEEMLGIQRVDSAELVVINDKFLKRTASDIDELKKEAEGLKEKIRKSEEEVIENKKVCDKEWGMIEDKMKKLKKWEEWLSADFKKLYNWKESVTRYVGEGIKKLPILSKYE